VSYVRPSAVAVGEDFSRGFIDTPETDTLHPGATAYAANAMLTRVETGPDKRRATMSKRRGHRLVTPTAMSLGATVDGLVDFRRETAPPQLLACCDGAWYAWNDLDTMTAISGATGYTPGASARGVLFKNQAWLFDGTAQQLYDGTTVRSVGVSKPTGVTNMTAQGTGLTGSYSARYTWYDQTHDHESSPTTDATSTLVLTNEGRRHTKPSGSPPAHVTHWRAYVRREDTSEVYWMRVATVAIGDATHDEAVIDAVRRDPLPGETANDPPTITPAVAAVWKGYGIAFPTNSSEMHVSTQGDIEAWNPRNVFKVSPGDGEAVQLAQPVGSEFVIMKPHRAWYLTGDTLPFGIEELHSSFGCVSQEAGVEVGRRFFAWDAVKGPYWTDLTNWVPLGDYRIEQTLGRINRAALDGIRAVHDEARSLVIWAVPTIGSTRRRTLLAYHYGLEAWLPPMTGLEIASLAQYTDAQGALRVYAGDYWGRLFALFDATRDGVPAGASTVTGTVTSATSSTLVDTAATFYTTGDGLAGLPVAVRSPAGGWQWRRIASNTADTLTLETTTDNPWTTTPAAGWTYIIGGIEWYWTTPWLDFGEPTRIKRLSWLFAQLKPASGSHALDVRVRFNDDEGVVVSRDLSFATGLTGGIWGTMVWGTSLWGALNRRMRKARLMRACFSLQLQFSNPYPDQPVEMSRYQVEGDVLARRRVGGAA
jgi:hypothetical protein